MRVEGMTFHFIVSKAVCKLWSASQTKRQPVVLHVMHARAAQVPPPFAVTGLSMRCPGCKRSVTGREILCQPQESVTQWNSPPSLAPFVVIHKHFHSTCLLCKTHPWNFVLQNTWFVLSKIHEFLVLVTCTCWLRLIFVLLTYLLNVSNLFYRAGMFENKVRLWKLKQNASLIGPIMIHKSIYACRIFKQTNFVGE